MTRRFVFTLALASLAHAQLPPEKVKKIEQLISSEMSRASVPGVSMVVAVNGKIQYANGFGMADLENLVPMTTNTRVRLASISKPIAAVAIMQLVEQGKIDLDSPIQRYVPQFPQKPWPITVRQLMQHTAGIRGYKGNEMSSTEHYTDVISPMKVFWDDPLLFQPGTAYSYSTYNYSVLGAMIENVTGRKQADLFRDTVFKPAGMDTISEDDVYRLIPHRARGYVLRQNGVVENCDLSDTSNKVSGGGLISTPADLAKFAIALMDGKLVKKETLAKMWTPATLADGKQSEYGLGFELRRVDGMLIPGHTGGSRGAQTYLIIIPERNVVIAYMMNLEASTALIPISRGMRAIMLEP